MDPDRPPRPSIRSAGPDDAEAIAAVHLASWRVAYRDAAPSGWLERQTVDGQTGKWHEILGQPGTRSRVLVVTADGDGSGAIIGFTGISTPSRDDDADEDTAEISSLYVDPDHWRAGAGRALMTAALASLAQSGFEAVTLWVLAGNARAIAFYEASGFADDGARKHSDWPVQIRMRRALT